MRQINLIVAKWGGIICIRSLRHESYCNIFVPFEGALHPLLYGVRKYSPFPNTFVYRRRETQDFEGCRTLQSGESILEIPRKNKCIINVFTNAPLS